ncbi:MAG: TonB-dependent receptor [Dysgonamonadaceae bacterium]|jgi:TonB-linked SusC/RagA family outer membrane protein|nr:TonB-dependent receptor [Dysgonamonadaceae bacterium]
MRKNNFYHPLQKCRFKKLSAFLFCLFLFVEVFAQTQKITGVVTNEKGEAVIGASISIKGTSTGTVTSADGNYSLVTDPNSTLTISYIGYVSQEIPVAGRTVINIHLQEDELLLEEVVVIGYGAIRKKDLTGAVSSVDEKTLSNKTGQNLGQAMQGRLAGVYIVDDGNPQSNVSIKIRGLGTVNNSNPLYVIDGVPSSLGLNSLNSEDIATIDVLKDASATAIYGSQGANGVVLITTKRGSGDGKLNFKAGFGAAQATNMPKFLDASQYAALSNQMLLEAGIATNPDWADPASLGKGTNWVDLMFRTATSQNYTLSYSGGNDKSNYYVSGGYTNQDGIIESVGFQRITLQFNSNHQVKPWVKFGNNITFSYDDKTNGSYNLLDVFRSLPTQRIYDDDGNYDGPFGKAEWVGTRRNQYATTMLDKNQTNGYNFLGNIYAEFSLFGGLKFKSVGGAQAIFVRTSNYTAKYDYKPTSVPAGSIYKNASYSFTYLWDNYFTYDKTFGDHYVNVMGGGSLQWNNSENFGGSAKDFLKEEVHQLSNAKEVIGFDGTVSEWAIASLMLRANYSYKNRYLLTATVRHDGSSRFGSRHRWGTFPSLSAAWRLSEENFYNKDAFMSDIKIRAGYGVTGHQNIGNYSYATAYDTGVYSFNDQIVNTLVVSKMPNPNVHWEEVHQTNVGADLGFLKNRFRLSLDLYDKNTKDMLVAMQVPVSSGYDDTNPPSINAGKVNNKGIEISVGADIINGNEFKWTADFNMSLNKNKIVSLNDSIPSYWGSVEMSGNSRVNAEGHPINSFYGHVADGLFQTSDEINRWAVQVVGTNSTNGTAPGDIRFLDLDNNGVIDDNDRTYIGNPFPVFTYALGNSFTWKNFDLSIFLQGIYGNKVYNANRIYLEAMSAAQNQFATVLDRWYDEGTSNVIPRAVLGDPNKNNRSSTRFIEDGSYLRIKDLTLGYTFPSVFTKKLVINNLRIYFSCKNLLTLTKYSGFDPEIGVDGFDLGHYPVTRMYNIGFDVTF